MKAATDQISHRVEELRQAFDQSFAEPLRQVEAGRENMLSVHIGQSDYCIRLSELATVAKSKKIVPIPNGPDGLVGVCGLREKLIAVFQLSHVLGTPAHKAAPRWLLVCKGNPEVAFGVEEINAYLQVSPSEMNEVEVNAAGPFVSHIIKRGNQRLGLLDVPAILDSLERNP